MNSADRLLDDAEACHDDDPQRAAALLREVDPAQLDGSRRPLLAFLLNHVLGESLGEWGDAHARQQALLTAAGADAPPVLWRQAAAAARLSGNPDGERAATVALAAAVTAPAQQAEHVVALTAASFEVPALPAAQAGRVALDALAPLQHDPAWRQPGSLDAAAAACCNNLSAHLSERPLEQLTVAPLRAAMAASGELAQALWQRTGTWVHAERACLQRAIVSNTLGEPQQARVHARDGLVLLDRNDTSDAEFVDRAFLEQELAHACARLGLDTEAARAGERARTLAARFGDAGLDRWFAARRGRLEALGRM
jgi:hypothetical protein